MILFCQNFGVLLLFNFYYFIILKFYRIFIPDDGKIREQFLIPTLKITSNIRRTAGFRCMERPLRQDRGRP